MHSKRPPGRPREEMSKKPLGKRVVAMKSRGLTFGEIAAKLQISRQRCHQVYRRVLAERLQEAA